MAGHGVQTELVRAVDHDIRPGVEADMGDGDAWPALREKLLAADILVLATPTWLGQHSSVAQRVLERLDAELSDTNDDGQPRTYGKVAAAVVVGNEDGAHHISAVLFQALNDVGFTIPAGGVTYWNGEAMQGTDYNDLRRPRSRRPRPRRRWRPTRRTSRACCATRHTRLPEWAPSRCARRRACQSGPAGMPLHPRPSKEP